MQALLADGITGQTGRRQDVSETQIARDKDVVETSQKEAGLPEDQNRHPQPGVTRLG